MPPTLAANARHEVRVEDVEYQRQSGRALLARLYRPSGAGPFPAALQVHGGAWVNKDRTDNDFMAKGFAERGIFVAAIDFRMPPEAPYPASLADINLGTRWLKAHAGEYRSRPDWIGSFGTSSGGHQVLLAAMRPDQRDRASHELDRLLDWCLEAAIAADGTILARAVGESLPDSYYFAIAFLDTVGFFDPRKRFWTDRSFPQAEVLRALLEDRVRALHPNDPMVPLALARLQR